MRKAIPIVAFAAALALGGCHHRNDHSAEATGSSTDNAGGATGGAISDAAGSVKGAVIPTPSAQEFIDRAARSDAFEIASARLAANQASSPDVKSFAAMMIADHTASTAALKMAAATAVPALTANAALTETQQGRLADLGRMTGKEFDKTYAEQQIDAHKDGQALMQVYADKGNVPSLKAAAAEILPRIGEHLEQIRAIRGGM